jgi:hypothetical protein
LPVGQEHRLEARTAGYLHLADVVAEILDVLLLIHEVAEAVAEDGVLRG